MNENKIQLATDLTQGCMLPELKTEIGDEQITAAHFHTYRTALNTSLHLLFDIIQKFSNELFENTIETESFRVHFVLMLCEQSTKSPFQTDQWILLQNIDALIQRYFVKVLEDGKIFNQVLNIYKTKIKGDLWKRNIGAVHGFCRFCELFFARKSSSLDLNNAMFLLSVGSLLMEYFEPSYNELGVDMLIILLYSMDKKELQNANIHQAVYSICQPKIQKVKEEIFNIKLWSCLYKCIELSNCFENVSQWNQLDDTFSALMQRIAFENNSRISAILYIFIGKFAVLSSVTSDHCLLFLRATDFVEIRQKINEICTTNKWNEDLDLGQLEEICRSLKNYSVYRWIKNLLLLLANQTIYGQNRADVLFELHSIHVCYVLCILGAPINKWFPSEMNEFHSKFLQMLLETAKRFRNDRIVRTKIVKFIATLEMHLRINGNDNAEWIKRCSSLETLRGAIIAM